MIIIYFAGYILIPAGKRSHVTGYPARSRDRSCDRHTATATRPSHPWPGHVPGYVPRCDGTFDHGNLPRALGSRALPAALGPLAPTATPSLWPMATLSSWPTLFVNHGRWRPSSLGGPRPLAASNLRRPLAHRAPLATIGYQGVVVIRNGRVIEPIVRGGGLGGISW